MAGVSSHLAVVRGKGTLGSGDVNIFIKKTDEYYDYVAIVQLRCNRKID